METAPMSGYERFVDTFFNPVVTERYLPKILEGMVVTLELAVLVVVTGIVLGLALACLRAYKIRAVNALIILFADMFRSLPPLVLILLFYFGLPNVGISLSAFLVIWIVLALTLGAFAEEIFWAGLTSVDRGQWQAARSTGLNFTQTLFSVIMPQAVRMTVPPLTNRAIAITKSTALGMVIGLADILGEATTAQSFSGNASPLMMAAIAYVILFLPLVIFSRWLETRFRWKRA
ncbi:amino acid ABC transporter permease [Acuticoccus sp. MNP-M23]|uniref:amino acid ABC transporter permease n=1 Tax=Acuticoccus sp. MNP-M23 TaxID=3072793 RepID=UPI002814E570|nr:amino acid ABC transporter permease [Acuticoccus sp. MNP-M23]WMS44031.1 amino acid ABC transporter permease [Acuticoccus sp. MNP-M23]